LCLFGASLSGQAPPYFIDTVAGSGPVPLVGVGGPATQVTLVDPSAVAISPVTGDIFVADVYYRRVLRIDLQGRIFSAVGTGEPGGCGFAAPAAGVSLTTPNELAFDREGNLWIADIGAGLLCQMTPDGMVAARIRGGVTGITFDLANNLVVAFGTTIFRLTPDNVFELIGGQETPGRSGNGGPAVDAEFSSIAGLAYDPAGNLYVVDSDNRDVRVIAPNGIVTPFAGTGEFGTGGVGGPALQAQFRQPTHVGIRDDGAVIVADFAASRIVEILPSGVLQEWFPPFAFRPLSGVSGFALDPVRGLVATSSNSLIIEGTSPGDARIIAGAERFPAAGDGGPATRARLFQPAGIDQTSDGTVVVADRLGRYIRAFDKETGVIISISGDGTFDVNGNGGLARNAAFGRGGGVSVSDLNEIFIVHTIGAGVRKIDGSGVITQAAGGNVLGFSGDGGSALEATFFGIEGVTVDPAGRIWIADTHNHRVRRVEIDGRVDTVAGTGVRGSDGEDGQARQAQLSFPGSIAVDSQGRAFLIEDNRVLRIGDDGRLVRFFPPPGQDLGLFGFRGGAFGPDGSLFVADPGLDVIHRISPEGEIETVAGQAGSAGFRGDRGLAVDALLNDPWHLFVDDNGDIYFTESANARVRKLTPLAEAPPPAVHAASFQGRSAAPGLILTVFAPNIGPEQILQARLDENGRIASELGGVRALFDGVPAPVIFVSRNQISIIVPYAVAGRQFTELRLELDGAQTLAGVMPVVDVAPGIFTIAGGTDQAVVLNQDGSLNSPDNPAAADEIVVFFISGEGQTSPPGVDGQLATSVFPVPLETVRVEVGGVPAQVLYAGAAPTFTAGLMQINIRLVGGFAPGLETSLKVFLGSTATQGGVTLATRAAAP